MSYRFELQRDWLGGNLPPAVFVMLNPSTADDQVDDPTIRKCVGFATRWGHTGIRVANLYGWRATDPRDLWSAADPVGQMADWWLARHIGHATGTGDLEARVTACRGLGHPRPTRAGGSVPPAPQRARGLVPRHHEGRSASTPPVSAVRHGARAVADRLGCSVCLGRRQDVKDDAAATRACRAIERRNVDA